MFENCIYISILISIYLDMLKDINRYIFYLANVCRFKKYIYIYVFTFIFYTYIFMIFKYSKFDISILIMYMQISLYMYLLLSVYM